MDSQNPAQNQEVKKTIVVYREMNEEECAKQLAYYREKQIHDEISALAHARREGFAEGYEEGLILVLRDLVNKGIITTAQAAGRANMPVSKFEAKAGLQ